MSDAILIASDIESLTFPKISDQKLIFRLPHGYFGSIRLSDGSYSGDMILHDRSGLVINDLENVTIRYPEDDEQQPMYIPIRAKIMTPLGDFWKTYRVYIDEPRVDLMYQFQLKPVSPFYFRIGNVVINPEAFDKSSLYYATVNGGEDIETYPLNGREVIHDRPVDLTVSTHHSLGATEGWITIGDQDKSVSVITNKGQLYSVPLLRYEEFQSIYFLRISHSIGETDETAHNFWQGHNKVAFTIVALGGFGSVPGAFFAGLIVGLMTEIPGFWDFCTYLTGFKWMSCVPMTSFKFTWVYLAYFVIMLVRPRGLFGWKQ